MRNPFRRKQESEYQQIARALITQLEGIQDEDAAITVESTGGVTKLLTAFLEQEFEKVRRYKEILEGIVKGSPTQSLDQLPSSIEECVYRCKAAMLCLRIVQERNRLGSDIPEPRHTSDESTGLLLYQRIIIMLNTNFNHVIPEITNQQSSLAKLEAYLNFLKSAPVESAEQSPVQRLVTALYEDCQTLFSYEPRLGYPHLTQKYLNLKASLRIQNDILKHSDNQTRGVISEYIRMLTLLALLLKADYIYRKSLETSAESYTRDKADALTIRNKILDEIDSYQSVRNPLKNLDTSLNLLTITPKRDDRTLAGLNHILSILSFRSATLELIFPTQRK